jgi:nucleotide-binding universal stress UspA family protein
MTPFRRKSIADRLKLPMRSPPVADKVILRELTQGPIFNKILIPVDGSSASMAGVYEAIRIASSQPPSLRLLHVVDEMYFDETFEMGTIGQMIMETTRGEAERILKEARDVLAAYALSAESRLTNAHDSRVATQIIREAAEWGADLIVMGTHGRRGLARLALGSSAEEVARASSVPVLLVRAGIWMKRDSTMHHLDGAAN